MHGKKFCNRAQGQCREIRQGGQYENDCENHNSECHIIGPQCTGTFRDVFLIGQNAGDRYRADDRNKPSEDEYYTRTDIPEWIVICESFKPTAIVSICGSKLIEHLGESMEARVV